MASIVDKWKQHPERAGNDGNRWMVRWRDPTKTLKSKTFRRKQDAVAWKTKVEHQLQTDGYIDPATSNQRPFRTVAEQWRDGRVTGATTKELYAAKVNSLIEHFGPFGIGTINAGMINAWQATRLEHVAISTLRVERWMLGSILKSALADRVINRSPMDEVNALPTKRRHLKNAIRPWSLASIGDVLRVFPSHLAPVAWLGFGAGLRQGECFGIGVDDIDLKRKVIHVERQIQRINGEPTFTPPKRHSYGAVPICDELVDLLSAYIDDLLTVETTLPWLDSEHPNQKGETRTVRLLCAGGRGAPLRRDEFNKHSWWPAVSAAGIDRDRNATGHHQLRHCFASYLLAEGKSLPVVQARLRHSTLEETVKTYAHLVPDAESDAMKDAIASVFRKLRLDADAETDHTRGD